MHWKLDVTYLRTESLLDPGIRKPLMASQRIVDWIVNLKHRCEKFEVKKKI